jgi:ketosteroid isomerase-like protein
MARVEPTTATTLVRSVIDALNRRDWDAALEFTADDFEYDLTRTASPLQGVHPRVRMPRVMDEFLGSWESVRYEPHEFIEAGDCLVVPFTTHFRGRDGIAVATDALWLCEMRGDTLARLTLFQDRDEALAAAGVAR